MRFYNFVLKTTSEKIKKGSKVNLREYGYDGTIACLNVHVHKSLKNGISFFVYREEENVILAVFSCDEKEISFHDAYGNIIEIFNSTFSVNQIKSDPCEITMYQFYECMLEAKRRSLLSYALRVVESAKLRFYDDYRSSKEFSKFVLEEKIISDKCKKDNPMYDVSVINELSNIETHQNTSDLNGSMVHYFISSKSVKATNDITEALMQRLVNANRLDSRRMVSISDIDPYMYRQGYLEEIIENNFGGVIVFDLSGKLDCESSSYGMTCKYIEELVKKYKNDCLFVFTYNIDRPGFSYQLLKPIRNYLLAVTLKEGTGDRKAAIKYLKELIKDSKYSEYVGQATEFMKLFPGNEFSQTDVLLAFEKFEPWCLNKNALNSAYDFNSLEPFMLDRDDNDSSYDKLQKLIGLKTVKEQIDSIIATDIMAKERKRRKGNEYETGTMHMIFGGNPGTAKTTVAKLFAGIAKEKGILKSGAFVECGGTELAGPESVRVAFMEAEGGVLFVDEAYSMPHNHAITALIQEMENHRDSVIVVLAGYNTGMREFLERNEGLKSRIPHWIDFPDYNADELTEIFKNMVKDRGFEAQEDAIAKAKKVFEKVLHTENFGNGRFARNLFERAVQNQSERLHAKYENAEKIRSNELFLIKADDITLKGEELKNEKEYGEAQKELDEMIGLSSVKAILKKIVAGFKLKKVCMEKGISKENPSLHMAFTGNPGTAKTTVARLLAQILKDEKVLESGKFVEVGRADLVGVYVGSTAPIIKKKFQEAKGGVLFIDEAYSLCDRDENSFGDEAINTIVLEMENHKADTMVIFAGYSDKMQAFLDRNPGMSSRIAFHVEFEDYTADELCDITKLLLSKKDMTITAAAMEKLRGIYEIARKDSSFGNGRFARKMLEEAEMNLAERVSQLDESELTTKLITTVEEVDIPEYTEPKHQPERKPIGF